MLLRDYRVLDLTDQKGIFCGKILADMGADVIKVEKPGGDSARNIGPFFHDIPDPEKSLYWFAFNTNKRGITLNIETSSGHDIFQKLVEKSDIVIESFPPGYMESLGLGYTALKEINPRIIMTAITPFGQTGPYKDFKAPDIVLIAMGGQMYTQGDPDRAPVRISCDQAYLLAGMDAALGTVIALYYRENSGEGQFVDVSAQESVPWSIIQGLAFWDMIKRNPTRLGPFRPLLAQPNVKNRHTWLCKDGYITFELLGGRMGGKSNKALAEWMASEGMADEFFKSIDWETLDAAATTQEFEDRAEAYVALFFERYTKKELFDEAEKRGIFLCPVADVEDIAEELQLKARDFWEAVDYPKLGTSITHPRAFIKSSKFDFGVRRRAPSIGEHNLEIYSGELKLSKEELVILKQAGVI